MYYLFTVQHKDFIDSGLAGEATTKLSSDSDSKVDKDLLAHSVK